MERLTKILVLAIVGLLITVSSVAALLTISGSSSGTITSTVTAADLQLTGTITSSGGASCSINTATTFSCSGFTIGQAGTETETFQVQNTGGTAATGLNPATSGITPGGASCVASGPATIPAFTTETYTLTFTAGQTTGSATCSVTVS